MNDQQAQILQDLAYESTPDQKKTGFIAALRETDHQYLVQPEDHFSSWDNCAIIFLMLSDEEIKPYLFELLGWIRDLNWPGAEWILERLQRVFSELLLEPFERAAKLAAKQNDESWLGWMSILIANPNMVNLLEDDTVILLKPYAIKYWNWDYD